jgi:hypothetical protein
MARGKAQPVELPALRVLSGAILVNDVGRVCIDGELILALRKQLWGGR